MNAPSKLAARPAAPIAEAASGGGRGRRGVGGILVFVAIGLVAGFLSGMFGVGGGILIVPALIYIAKLDPRVAVGTSLLAILPISLAGVTTYAIGGHVDVLVALLLAAGSLAGAPIGARLLHRLPMRAVRGAFLVFVAVVIVSLFIVIPSRDAVVEITWLTAAGLVGAGFVTGVCSGLLGVGGGVIIVPALTLLFGSSDLMAKGSSLLMMIATSAMGTFSNIRARNLDVAGALCVGGAAALTTSLGGIVAAAVSPQVANIAFAGFLVLIGVRMAIDLFKRPAGRDEVAEAVSTFTGEFTAVRADDAAPARGRA